MKIKIDAEFESYIPALAGEELAELKASIDAHGCRDPLVVWSGKGILLDGHNRYRICTELGVKYRTVEIALKNREAALDWIDRNQIGRRNLSPDAFRLLLGRIYNRTKKDKGGTGANQHTKQIDQSDLSATSTAATLAKQYGVSEATVKRAGKFAEKVEQRPELQKAIVARVPVAKAEKEIQTQKREAERSKIKARAEKVKPSDRWSVHHADIRTWRAERQYDWIITDPPYPREFLPLYDDLGRLASECLKDGGLLVAMSGQSYLDDVYAHLSKHMQYYWTACYLTPGQPTPLRQVNVNTSWKPLLIFAKGKPKCRVFGDVFKSDQNEKDHHKWGQSVSGMTDIVTRLCVSGEYILDPFCGAGTTGIAAIKHGCFFDGLEIDEDNVKISRGRIDDATKE